MELYEYKVAARDSTPSLAESDLNRYGKKGWELVAINDNHLYLKRILTMKVLTEGRSYD